MILDDIVEGLIAKTDELEVEGINTVEYWLAKVPIDSEEFFEFVGNRSERVAMRAPTLQDALFAVWIDAFLIGMQAGRRGGRWRH